MAALERAHPAAQPVTLVVLDAGALGPGIEEWLRRRLRVDAAPSDVHWRAYAEWTLRSRDLDPTDVADLRERLHAWAHRPTPVVRVGEEMGPD
ncbi:hypothetical protein [Pseudonocardia nigra]|uniref:hypothetical protein n=1 Tax=Pseudonocardia nigra TaxID=1921578 RepID=UPI001C5D1023|nr:hypothetical protein [Pseudonocardia nigra]